MSKHLLDQEAFYGEEGNERFNVDFGIESLSLNGEDKGHVLAITCNVVSWSKEEVQAGWVQLMGVISAFLAAENLT